MMLGRIAGLSKKACEEWLAARRYVVPYPNHFDFSGSLAIPDGSCAKSGLIKSILTWLPSDNQCLLWIVTSGVWPTCENQDLFDRVRASLGEKRQIEEVPGQVINLADRGPLESLLDICIYSLWDAVLADEEHRFCIECSHDESMIISCRADLESDARRTMELFTHSNG
jgi:hypothetical protein